MQTSHDDIKVEKQKAHFDSISHDYYEATQDPNCFTYNQLLWAYVLRRHSQVLPLGARVLEPMCGHGIAKGHFAKNIHHNFHYTGFDNSELMVEIAKKRMPGSCLFVQDVTRFEPTEQYDVIFLAGGLHHVYAQTDAVLANLKKALVPGGHLISAEPTYDNPIYGAIGRMLYKKNDVFDDVSEQRYSLAELNQSYEGAGFSMVEQLHTGLLAYVMAVSVLCFSRIRFGSPLLVRWLMKIEQPFYKTWLARKLSFSTISVLQHG